mmetsp:Transcript_27131/g.19556  ORF Transcript_27131/g.19556 Transcript_27131/m.19556 type:complete len:91 (+) Transcript_27131:531-803(+)
MCDTCVFLMDHHCPWVNNCIGLDNLRYFLLFIFYLHVGVIYNAISIIVMWKHYNYRQYNKSFTFLLVLDLVMMFILIGFNGWNWYLAMTG